MSERSERQTIAPRTRPDGRVGAYLKVVVGDRFETVDDEVLVGRVRRPVVGRLPVLKVEHLVQDDLAVTMFPRRRVPLQLQARRTQTDRREVLRSSGRNCLKDSDMVCYSFIRQMACENAIEKKRTRQQHTTKKNKRRK